MIHDVFLNLDQDVVEPFGFLHLLAVYAVDLHSQVTPLVHVEAHRFDHRFQEFLLCVHCIRWENEIVTAFEDLFLHGRGVEDQVRVVERYAGDVVLLDLSDLVEQILVLPLHLV